jgi:hypothetical protein
VNAAVSESLYKYKVRAETAEADLERLNTHTKEVESKFSRVRDRAMEIILSRTADVDRLKKELDVAKKLVLRADAEEFTPSAKPLTLRDAVLQRLKEKGITPNKA